MKFSIRCMFAMLAATAIAGAAEPPRSITLAASLPFAEGAAGDVGITAVRGGMTHSIEQKCGLQRSIASSIAAAAGKRRVTVVLSENPETATGPVLTVVIEGVMGMWGGAWTGVKTLTLRGELRDGGTLLGSFVARQENGSITKNTCESLMDAGKKVAVPIAKWLANPVPKARLGKA